MLDQSSVNHSKHLEVNVEINSSRMEFLGKQFCQINLLLFYTMPEKKHWISCVLTVGSLLTLSLMTSPRVKKPCSGKIC